ncbi:MAG: RnfABCDGE type electron transport complex subunit G [Clostridia bacterium]|nr:RnfABCDGE type electron transport complex subunit G [Clostridia bacterium]
MINPKEIVRVGLILFVITALSALLLAFANKVTAPIIEENNRIKTEAAMRTILPEAETFTKVEVEGVDEVYIGKTADGIAGVCVVSSEYGYGGEIKLITGINSKGEVTGIDLLSHSETPGLGAKAEEPEFTSQFEGKTKDIAVSRGKASGNEINAMSGATITSKAVTDAVNKALEAAQLLLNEQ